MPIASLWHRVRRSVYGSLLGLLCSGVVLWAYYGDTPFSRRFVEFELNTYNDRAHHRALMLGDADGEPVTIVAIDETSLNSFSAQGKRYPWPRDVHATLVRNLKAAGARVIAFDINFNSIVPAPGQRPDPDDYFWEPEPSAEDIEFAAAIAEAGNVVLAATIDEAVEEVEGHEELVQVAAFPAAIFDDAALIVGDVEVPVDVDKTVRRAQLRTRFRDETVPSFPVAVVAAYTGTGSREEMRQSAVSLADRFAVQHADALEEDGSFWIDFHGEPPTAPTVSYIMAHAGQQAELFRDKIVLIGASAPDLQDLFGVPVRSAARGTVQEELMPGVEIHANAIRTLLAERLLHRAPDWVAIVSTLLLGCVTGLATMYLRPVRALLIYVPVIAAAVIALAFWLFSQRNLWVNAVLPAIGGIAVPFVGTTVLAYLTVERERRHIQAAWSKRVSPEVLRTLLQNPRLQHVQGRTIHATVLFSDLRGFTTLCHTWPPEEVVRRLNGIFDRMTRVIIGHGGTIDKFIGDGIMAVFGDPVPYDDHARRAVLAAIDMLRAMRELQREATARGDQPIEMGVGIHTGELVAGDIGSELFLEYTAIGDTVSTASRLEGLNKEYHTNIICSGDVLALAGAGIEARLLDTTTVRGRDTPLQVFEVAWQNADTVGE